MAQIFAGIKRFGASLLDFHLKKRRASSLSTKVDYLHLSFESVDIIEDLVSSGNLLNRRQCMDLSSKLSGIIHNVQQLVTVHSGAASDIFKDALKYLYQVFEKARLLVEKCCKNDWVTESIFQIGNEKDFQSILLDAGLGYHAIYEQAKGMSEEPSFQHKDLRQSHMFRSLPIGEVQKDQDDLKKRLEAVGSGRHSSKNSQQEKLDLEQRIACYLLLRWECASHQTQADEFSLQSNSIMWKESNRMGALGNNSYLGSGSSGGVIGSTCMGMSSAAVKFYRGEVDESLFSKEAGILSLLNHPQIIKFFCCGNDEENGNFIAMERMEMNLARLISLQAKKEVPFSFLGAFDIVVQIARGMRYLHSMGVAHRDLKPENVVVDKLTSPHLADRYCVKLVDFGMSKTKVEASKSDLMSAFRIGTTMYRAPELHEKAHSEGSSGKTNWCMADVYSFAITCAQILSLQEPFKKLARSTLHEDLMRGVRPELPRTCPKELVVLLNDCWNTHSILRPTFQEICSKLEVVKCSLLRGVSTVDNGLHQVPINFASNQFIWTKVEENATIQGHSVNTCNEDPLGIFETACQESSPNMQIMEERSCEQVPPFLELDALQDFATHNIASCGSTDSYINAVPGPSQPWKKYVPETMDEVEFVVEKSFASGEPLSFHEASYLRGGFQQSLNLALDSCELQALEYRNLLPLVKVYQHQCKNLVETLEPTIVIAFGRCHKALDALKNFEIGKLGAISGRVHSCLDSLIGLAQKLQLVVDLFRKCASDDVHKTALELADLPLPSLMPRWSEFSLAIRDCEWYLDLIQLAFCTLEKLLSGGSQLFLDASFKWSEAKGRMVLQIQDGQERHDQCTTENPMLDVSKELEAKDTADLIQQLLQLALKPGNVTKWRLSGVSSKADFEKACMARFLSSKLSGPIPRGRYLPWTFRMEPSTLKFREYLDSGSSGMVATHSWLGATFAVKCIRSPGLNRHRIEEEAAILARVQHPNVVRFIGCAFIDKNEVGMLAMELMDGDLRTIIDSRSAKLRQGASPFPTTVAIDVCLQIAQGMQHLHRFRVLHRDLKAKNVLVKICKPFYSSIMASNMSLGQPGRRHSDLQHSLEENSYVVKLADFGLAKCRPQYSGVATRMAGTTGWRAPEVFYAQDTEVYKWPADVYSFAMTCYEIWTGNIPFGNCAGISIHEHVIAGGRPQGWDELDIPEHLKELVKRCWATNPDKRPTFEEVVKSLWECKVRAIVPVFQRRITNRHFTQAHEMGISHTLT